MGTIYTQEQFDGIRKRISYVDERINGFNEEVEKATKELYADLMNVRQRIAPKNNMCRAKAKPLQR